MKRMEIERIAKRVHVGECVGNHSMGRTWKRWIDTMKERLRKRGLDVKQGEWCRMGVNGGGLCRGMHGA